MSREIDPKDLTVEQLQKYFHNIFLNSPKDPVRDVIFQTGPDGARNMEYMIASATMIDASVKELLELKMAFDNKHYPPGAYTVSTSGIKWHGYEDLEAEDGCFLFKDSNEGKWYLQTWKDHWLRSEVRLSEEEAQELIEKNESQKKQ